MVLHLTALVPHSRPNIQCTHPPSRSRPPVCVREDASELLQQIPDIDASRYRLGTAEAADVPACVQCLMDGFYKDILTLAKEEFTEAEMETLRPVLSALNGAFMRLTRFTLTFEARKRLATRLELGGLQRGAIRDALMLVLQERATGAIVGVAELSQQPRDGRVPGDVRLPSMPWASQPPWVAYVSNLAVSKAWRGRRLGSLLVASCEQVALRWGFDEIYLHAATQQEQLLRMYDKLDYDALPSFDQPAWVLMVAGREPTRYHRKVLRASVSGPAPVVEA